MNLGSFLVKYALDSLWPVPAESGSRASLRAHGQAPKGARRLTRPRLHCTVHSTAVDSLSIHLEDALLAAEAAFKSLGPAFSTKGSPTDKATSPTDFVTSS